MVIFEFFFKAMPPSLSESKVLPSFCLAFKIPDNRAASNVQHSDLAHLRRMEPKKLFEIKLTLARLVSWHEVGFFYRQDELLL